MDSMQRKIGRLTHKGGGNESKIAVLLQEYEAADKMLNIIIEASKSWRDAWLSILSLQLNLVISLEELYNPIVGATSDGYGHEPVVTPQAQVDRVATLKEAFTDLKTDLLDEVKMMDPRIIQPAVMALDYIQPIKKTIKKREKKRIDYERAQDKLTSVSKKAKRSEMDVAKAEAEMSKTQYEFNDADSHLRNTLPPLVEATFSLLPRLLAAQIMTQNTLLAQYYTVLHNYCLDQGLPSPPPPMADVITKWESAFRPIQREIESTKLIVRGKAVQQPMRIGDEPVKRQMNLPNGLAARRASSQMLIAPRRTSPSPGPDARIMRIPSSSSIPSSSARSLRDEDIDSDHEPQPPAFPGPRPTSLMPSPSHLASYSPAGPTRDHFAADRRLSDSSTTSSLAMTIAGKKKPPPPPPKRLPSANSLFVTALYDFSSQEPGDLGFREGDRIRVLKKTNSTDDWWDGELRGKMGKFPANYCEER